MVSVSNKNKNNKGLTSIVPFQISFPLHTFPAPSPAVRAVRSPHNDKVETLITPHTFPPINKPTVITNYACPSLGATGPVPTLINIFNFMLTFGLDN